jgi:hypothetical protein
MFRPLRGFKAKYHNFNLVVSADFDEWRVLALGPNQMIVGQRQFSEARAKEHAKLSASSYIKEQLGETPPDVEPEWVALGQGEFVDFRP